MESDGNRNKTYVLDASVLLYSPTSLFAFDEHEVVIPASVWREIQERAGGAGETGANAREICYILDGFREQGENLNTGVPFNRDSGGSVKISGRPDHSIIKVAQHVGGIIVSRNAGVRVDAGIAGVSAEEYKAEQVSITTSHYRGRCLIYCSAEELGDFNKNGQLQLGASPRYITTEDGTLMPSDYKLSANEFVTLLNASNPDGGTLLGRYDARARAIVKLRLNGSKPFGVDPRNSGQHFALEALLAPASEAPLVILKGPAGTAKTFLSMAAGLEQTYNRSSIEQEYTRVLVTRPNTKLDEDIGFLKGTEEEKIAPLIRPIVDNIENLMPKARTGKATKDGSPVVGPAEMLFNNGVVVAQAMAFMRGRSICDTYIIVDEAQNASVSQILALVTRVGEGSKIVLLGDPDQIDHPYLDRRNNGLSYAAERMRGSPLCWQVTFSDSECTRSRLASEAISLLTPKGAAAI